MARITIMEGAQEGRIFELEGGRVKIGRKPDNDIVLDNPSISSAHCELDKTDKGWNIRDLNSTNGTRLNHKQITNGQLHNGDTLILGSFPLKVEGDDLPGAPEEKSPSETSTAATRVAISPLTSTDAKPVARPKDFGKRRDSRKIWLRVIVFVVILIVLATALFIHQLL